jgi:hypothetical protein
LKEGKAKPLTEEPWGPTASVLVIEEEKVERATKKEGAFSWGRRRKI